MNLRIAMITPEFPLACGGIGYYVYYLSKELERIGCKVYIIVRGKKNRAYTFHDLEVREISVLGIPPFNNVYFAQKLTIELKKIDSSIIHIHSVSMPAIKSMRPIVVTSHCCIKENTHSFYLPIASIESFYRNIMYIPYCRVESKIAKNSDRFTVVSESMRADYKNAYGVDSVVVYNGVDTKLFSPSAKTESMSILYFGALKQGKGLLDLLKAVSVLNKKHPDYNYHIYGNGPLREKIQSVIRKNRLSNVSLHDPVGHSDLATVLGKSAVFVLPSYYEGLPNSILEAMACEVPVVASKIKGNAELVIDNVNGLLFQKGDHMSLVEKLETLMESQPLRASMGKMGRKIVLDNFTWDKVAERFISIYKALE